MIEDTVIVEALKAIAQRNDGEITPEEVVAEAEMVDSPLHHSFEWDDGLAAHAHRLHQARTLLNRHRSQVLFISSTRTIMTKGPIFVRNPEAMSGEQSYVAMSRLRQPDMKEVARLAVIMAYQKAIVHMNTAKFLATVLEHSDIIDEHLWALKRSLTEFMEEHPAA